MIGFDNIIFTYTTMRVSVITARTVLSCRSHAGTTVLTGFEAIADEAWPFDRVSSLSDIGMFGVYIDRACLEYWVEEAATLCQQQTQHPEFEL